MKTRQDGTWKLAMAFTLAMLGVMPSASAQPAAPAQKTTPSPDPRKQADEFFQRGYRLYKQAKWQEAYTELLAAWELNPTYDVAGNLGMSESKLGKHRDAAEHLAFSLRHTPLTREIDLEKGRKRIQQKLEEVRRLVASVTLQVNLPGATVFIDSKAVGRAPLTHEIFVEPGARVIEAKLAGYEDAQARIDAPMGGELTVPLELSPSAPAQVAPPAPPAPAPAPPPPPPPQQQKQQAPPPVAPGPQQDVLIAGGVASGAALIAAVVFTVVSGIKASAAQTKLEELHTKVGSHPCLSTVLLDGCQILWSRNQSSDRFHDLAVGAYVAAGTLGVATLAYALWPARKARSPAAVSFAPTVGPGAGGLLVSGKF